MVKKGLVFGIQHFSIHDGDGIRSNVFLKGCPLRCVWCHNPEGLRRDIDLQYIKNNCRGCGRCGFIFRNMEKVYGAGREQKETYAAACPYGALAVVGEWMTAQEVVDEVMQDKAFFEESGGGITLSGGEPMMQAEFAGEVLKTAKEKGLSTAMETSGCAPLEKYLELMPYVDEFLWDYKETDEEKHKTFTGVSNRRILENLEEIHRRGAGIVLRCPIIPGLNDTEEHFRGIAEISQKLKGLKGVELMPYHKFGVAKDQRIGRGKQREYRVPTEEQKKEWEHRITKLGGRIFS